MLKKFIIAGCECFLTERTGQKILAQIAAEEAAKNLWNAVKEARRTWEKSGDPADWDYYSDLYKDLNGFRPRF